MVESVDRAKLLAGLQRGAHDRGRDLDVLLQVSLDPPDADGRSGADPAALADLAARVAEHGSPAAARADGRRAARARTRPPRSAGSPTLRAGFVADHPDATVLSAGMSGDLEDAVRAGATHVRVGSAILGPRPRDK